MDFKEFTEKALRTINKDLSDKELISMLCMGLAGETGEVVDYMKKVCYHGKAFDKENLILELGDLMWYFANLTHLLDISFDEILEKNVEKLLKRYPNGFERRK